MPSRGKWWVRKPAEQDATVKVEGKKAPTAKPAKQDADVKPAADE